MKFGCAYCNARFVSVMGLARHMDTLHGVNPHRPDQALLETKGEGCEPTPIITEGMPHAETSRTR